MKDLFLCHTGADKEWVRMLAERLEQERIGGRAVEVFFDEWDIDIGENIITRIDRGLKESRNIGLVLSPKMLAADWPNAEWQSQIMDDPSGKAGRIIPILRHKYDPDTGAPIELPFVLKSPRRLDFSIDKRFESEFARLVRKLADLPPTRGTSRGGLGAKISVVSLGQEAPDPVDEALPSNLFGVSNIPKSCLAIIRRRETSRRCGQP